MFAADGGLGTWWSGLRLLLQSGWNGEETRQVASSRGKLGFGSHKYIGFMRCCEMRHRG